MKSLHRGMLLSVGLGLVAGPWIIDPLGQNNGVLPSVGFVLVMLGFATVAMPFLVWRDLVAHSAVEVLAKPDGRDSILTSRKAVVRYGNAGLALFSLSMGSLLFGRDGSVAWILPLLVAAGIWLGLAISYVLLRKPSAGD